MEVGAVGAAYLPQLQQVMAESRSVNQERIMAERAEREEMAAKAFENSIDLMRKRVETAKVDLYA